MRNLIREWRDWLSELPWEFRWFPLLVLLRPLIDNFYFLKHISPFLSPLYIVGVLTPALVLRVVWRYRTENRSVSARFWAVFSFFMLLNALAVLVTHDFSVLSMQIVLKFTMPVYLYYFLRRLVLTKRDLQGVLRSYLLSQVFVLLLFGWELAFGPIREEYSRGLLRFQGNFGDVASYGLYINMAWLVGAFFVMQSGLSFQKIRRLYIVALLVSVAMFLKFNHAASYAIFATIQFLLLARQTRQKGGLSVLLLVVFAFFWVVYNPSVLENLYDTLRVEIAVLRGEADIRYFGHGRMQRWIPLLLEFREASVWNQLLGWPLKLNPKDIWMFGDSGTHSDYFRLVFLTGLLGAGAYFGALFAYFRSAGQRSGELRFLMRSTIIVILLYSVSLTPTSYFPLMYIVLSIFAYFDSEEFVELD